MRQGYVMYQIFALLHHWRFAASLILVPGLAAALSGVALAQDAASTATADSDEIVKLDEFAVSTTGVDRYRSADAISAVRIRAPLIDTPSSISVLTRDMIDDLGPTRIFDMTRYVAGVQEGRGIQFSDRQIIRGFENNGRTVDNFLQGGQGGSSADNFDEALVERVEVAKGPNAILSPSGSPGGSINVISKSPLYTSQRSVTGLLGLYDAQKITIDMTGALSEGSPFAYRLVTAFQDSRRYWSDDTRLRGRVFAPMLSYRLSDRTQLSLKIIAAEHWVFREAAYILDPSVTAETDDPFLAPGFKAKSRNGIQPWSHVGTHTADAFVTLTSNINEHISTRFAANGRYYFEDSKQEFFSTPTLTNRYDPYTGKLTQDYTWALNQATGAYVSTYSPFFNPNSIPVRGDVQATRHKTGTIQNDWVFRYPVGAVSTQSVVGWALARQTNYGRTRTGTLPAIDLNNPDVRAEPAFSPTFASYNISAYTNYQLYINERIGFWTDRILLTGGVLRYDTKTSSSNALTTAPASLLDDAKDMYLGSILVKPLKNVSVYYSYSTNSTPTIANNQAIWRDGKQHEVGVKSEFFNQRLSLSGAWFEIAQTNVTVPNPERQTNPSAPENLVSDLDNHGYELELFGGITRDLSIVATYTHLKMRDSLGRRVRAVADENASVLVNYRFHQGPLARLALNVGVSYNGRRAGDTPAVNFTPLGIVAQPSFYVAPYYVTTAGASYSWGRYTFRVNVDNFLDEKDYVQQAGGRVSGTGLSTAPGINVKLATTVRF